jgi:hypothetical protein
VAILNDVRARINEISTTGVNSLQHDIQEIPSGLIAPIAQMILDSPKKLVTLAQCLGQAPYIGTIENNDKAIVVVTTSRATVQVTSTSKSSATSTSTAKVTSVAPLPTAPAISQGHDVFSTLWTAMAPLVFFFLQ